jgi:hypothetical protein
MAIDQIDMAEQHQMRFPTAFGCVNNVSPPLRVRTE